MFLPFFSPMYISLIDLKDRLQIFNYQYTFLMTNMLIIIIDLLVYNFIVFYYMQDTIHLQLSMKIKVESCIDG